jgi:formamidopyrimidine-DNA glycosylase
MPELPDVENYRRVLARNGLRKTIQRVVVRDARILGRLSARKFASRLHGRQLIETRRHGKHLLARIDRGGWLALHFGMIGALAFVRAGEDDPPFTRVRFEFARDGCLVYTSKRMLGRVGMTEDAGEFIAGHELGPDALDRHLDFAAFKAALLEGKSTAKSALMNQKKIAGIGNIFADEILFRARIDPTERTDRLEPAELRRLFRKMRDVLETSITRGAGSEHFAERVPRGFLIPERRKGGQCPRCGSHLKLFKAGSRTGYCCPRCQRC